MLSLGDFLQAEVLLGQNSVNYLTSPDHTDIYKTGLSKGAQLQLVKKAPFRM